jgi:hypothetical protein
LKSLVITGDKRINKSACKELEPGLFTFLGTARW